MYEPVEVNLSRDELSVGSIHQYYLTIENERKFDLLMHLLKRDQPRSCIIFCRTKRGADKLAHRLEGKVRGVAAIHGDLAQSIRNRVMKGFRDGTITVLVATDVVGRGIDVNDISHVINFDLPDDPENYLHRIGRTGRMGKDGIAYTFVCPDQGEPLTAIELLINKTIPSLHLDDFVAYRRPERYTSACRVLYSTAGAGSRAD
jgi:ATP-dependent RNA helicase DeaD